MNFSSTLLENAVNEFAKLPGIGKKTALRLVLHLLKQEVGQVQLFSQTMADMREGIQFCSRCHNVSDTATCNICNNPMRRNSQICVVETIRDVMAIENTNQFNGTYHILGGLISPINGIGPDTLNIDALINRVQTEGVKEIIMAISATMEGDTTVFYLSKIVFLVLIS